MTNFDSLVAALEGFFDKPLCDLSDYLRERVKCSFTSSWDEINSNERRSVAEEWDSRHDAASQEESSAIDALYSEFEEAKKQISAWELLTAPVASEKILKDETLVALQKKHDELDIEIKELRGDYHEAPIQQIQQANNSETSDIIIRHFPVFRDPYKNKKWWDTRMRNAKRYGLLECRCTKGRAKIPSTWFPGPIAVWLVDNDHMSAKQAANTLHAHFPHYSDEANLLSLENE